LQGEEGLEQARHALNALKATGAKVRRDCGVHVHHEASHLSVFNIKNILRHYAQNEDIFDAIMPRSRRDNNNIYCQSLTNWLNHEELEQATNMREICSFALNQRYVKLNVQSFRRHGTLEFRQHAGSTNPNKIINWVRLTNKFIEQFKNVTAPIDGGFRERFETIVGGAIAQTDSRHQSRMKMQDLKQLVYRQLGLTTTKQVKQWARQHGLGNLDLRKKSAWAQISQQLAIPQTGGDNNLLPFYRRRMSQLGTAHLLAA
jgi:hypothetical protein